MATKGAFFMSGIQLVIGLISAGGAIAYFGDRIGMKVGRKRLTLFGLRPKHTSIIITIVTGGLIAGASIGLLLTVSRDVRNSLFRMKEIQTELRQNRQALLESHTQLKELEATVAEQRADLIEIEQTRDAAVQERDTAKAQRDQLQAEYDGVKENIGALQQELEGWKKRVAELKDLGSALEDTVQKLRVSEQQLRAEMAVMSEQYMVLEDQLRDGNFAFLKEDIIAAKAIAGGRGQKQIEADLLALLEEADAIALQRGAKIAGKERAVVLAHDDYFFQAVQVLVSEQGRWVVRAVATQNTVRGEPVRVYFHLFPNERIYKKGDVIAKRSINGSASDSEQALLALLQDVNRTAIGKGMITTATGDVGRVTGEQFIEALLQLRRLGNKATVAAIAAEDVYLADGPLRLELQVSGESS
jgi:uncharacterized protein (DUF3084 family)